ncbi:MAG: MATE family efflux transporter [Calditerrivibrio sp.]|nr:MATE family efflux transporter [Calditerrivibrio sp.]
MENKSVLDYVRNSWSNSWPMVLIMFFEFAIGITDVYIAGKISKEVQASIGFVSQIYFILIVVGNAFNIGVVAVASRLFTAEKQEFYKLSYTAVVAVFFISIILASIAFILTPLINDILSPPEELKYYIRSFLEIYIFMIVFHYLLIVTNGILRSSKMIKKSLITMSIVCVLNIGTNILYVFYLGVGFRGLVLSTLTAIFVGALINIYHLRDAIFKVRIFDKNLFKKAISIGWPTSIVQIGWQLASIIIYVLISKLPEKNTTFMAAFTNGMRIESIIFLPSFAFSMANAVIIGNLLGEKRYEDAYRNSLWTTIMGSAIISIMTMLVVFNAENIANLLSKDEGVVKASIHYIYISAISEPFMAIGTILIGGLNGAGDTKATMKRILGSLWGVRIPLAFLGVVLGFGAYGIWWAMTISIIVQAMLIFKRYYSRRWIKYEI